MRSIVPFAGKGQRHARWFGLWLWLIVAGGCATLPPANPRTLLLPAEPHPSLDFAAGPVEQALPQLILAENEAARRCDLDLLSQLWAPESRIVDGRGTAAPGDDYSWAGRAAVLDRYVVAVFPNPPPPLSLPADLSIQSDGSSATVENGHDRWQFVQREGRWWISELVYSRP